MMRLSAKITWLHIQLLAVAAVVMAGGIYALVGMFSYQALDAELAWRKAQLSRLPNLAMLHEALRPETSLLLAQPAKINEDDVYADTALWLPGQTVGQNYRMLQTSFQDAYGVVWRIRLLAPMSGVGQAQTWAALGCLLLGLLAACLMLLARRLTEQRLWRPFYEGLAVLRAYHPSIHRKKELPETTVVEFRDLFADIDQLLLCIEQAYDARSNANRLAARDLGPVIQTLEAHIEAKMQEPWLNDKQTTELEQLAHVDEDLQQLRRHLQMLEKMERGGFVTISAVQVRSVVQQCVLSMQLQLEERQVTVQFDFQDDVTLRTSQRMFEALVSYLLRLTLQQAQPKAVLTVRFKDHKLAVQAAPALLENPDEGPVAFEEVLAAAVCNFWRAKASFRHEADHYVAEVDCGPLTEGR